MGLRSYLNKCHKSNPESVDAKFAVKAMVKQKPNEALLSNFRIDASTMTTAVSKSKIQP